MIRAKPFWEKPLASLDRGEWEALCDGCGRCCVHKIEDEETGDLYATNVACKLLDRRTGQCTDYARRKSLVADCVTLDRTKLDSLDWLPETCAYRLRSLPKPERVRKIGAKWAPYSTVACWYLWRSLDAADAK